MADFCLFGKYNGKENVLVNLDTVTTISNLEHSNGEISMIVEFTHGDGIEVNGCVDEFLERVQCKNSKWRIV